MMRTFDSRSVLKYEHNVEPGKEGLYSIYFVSCFDREPLNFEVCKYPSVLGDLPVVQ